ncbi:hypothetical protein E6Q11_06235 [Candidatus Dojkabacteria bacterium]|uniref:Uncharacterized protein n=1 Tax=Candidatus Dojkabacteria bacterium TaxID=2099670 RepID=A0A5C7J336_9BACT|nr:MAG: hypothetical protein E6Q11_06235 [Candidatus Dojkabacteria bacterium]
MILRSLYLVMLATLLWGLNLTAMQQDYLDDFINSQAKAFISQLKKDSGDSDLKNKEQLQEFLNERINISLSQSAGERRVEVTRVLNSFASAVQWNNYREYFMSHVQPAFAASVEKLLGMKIKSRLGCYIELSKDEEELGFASYKKVTPPEYKEILYREIDIESQISLHLDASKRIATAILSLL